MLRDVSGEGVGRSQRTGVRKKSSVPVSAATEKKNRITAVRMMTLYTPPKYSIHLPTPIISDTLSRYFTSKMEQTMPTSPRKAVID